MVSFQENAEIIRREQVSKDIVRLTLQAPEIAGAASPGQFVMVRVLDGFDPLLRRPFSVHQVAAGGRVQILFKVIGKGTKIMADLDTGMRLDLVGPLGRGFEMSRSENICLLGGGIGIAPLLYLAVTLLQATHPPHISVLLGARTREQLDCLAEDFQNLGLTVQTATDDGSMGHHGTAIDLMDNLDNSTSWSVYACGPYPMMRSAAQYCKKHDWKCQVSLETFMACGLAACLGCVVPAKGGGYMHACKDGPVFKADELLWL